MEEPIKHKRRWPWFLGGFLVGSLLTFVVMGWVIFCFVIGDLRNASKAFEIVALADESARNKIEGIGEKLPASATNLYYEFQPQFADYHDTWISFSASAADC
jgi:hypothetical protein